MGGGGEREGKREKEREEKGGKKREEKRREGGKERGEGGREGREEALDRPDSAIQHRWIVLGSAGSP